MRTNHPKLPDGLAVRPATMDDADAVTDLLNACSTAAVGRATSDADEQRSFWRSPYLNPETNCLVALDGDAVVGYASAWIEPPAVSVYASARVRPEAAGRGLGTYLAAWTEELARARARVVAPEGARIVIQQVRPATHTTAGRLLEGRGYRDVRHSYRMRIELDGEPPEPQFPPGIEMQGFDRTNQLRTLVQAEKDIFRDHWGFVELDFEQDVKAWEQWIDDDPHHKPEIWFLAMDGDEIAGVCLCSDFMAEDPWMGYVESLGVQRAWRRKGLGLAMLHYAFRHFRREGKTSVTLDVDAQSLTGATRLYEKAGMHVEREDVTFELVLREGKDLTTQVLEAT